MPEGHTVHRLADAFNAQLCGNQVDVSSPQGRFAEGAAMLDGRVLEAAEAHGKHMFLRFSGGLWLRVHLGLYGMWRFHGAGLEGIGRRRRAPPDKGPDEVDAFPPPPRGQVRLRLVAGRHVADLSGPTACTLMADAEKHLYMTTLGQDPLRPDADPARAYAKLHASRSPIALLLMRQDIVAGIGNIYRAELLFRQRLEPHHQGRALGLEAWDALWADLTALLQEGVRTGRIVTVTKPSRGKAPAKRGRGAATYVAHRKGLPCRICGTPVLAEPMAGRTLYWCATCQVL